MVEPIDKKPDEVPVIPPPVEPPEYFPGFGEELTQLGVEQYKAQQRLAEAQKQLGRVTAPVRLEPFALRPTFFGFMLPTLPWQKGEEARREEEVRLAQQEFDFALQEFKAVIWRQEVLTTLPNYLSIPDYKLQSPEDILQYIPLDEMRDEDTVWLTATFDRLKHLSNILPEGWEGDAIEAQTKILDEILTAPKLELKAVHNLTVDEIAKSFAFGVAQLPQGMTEEDVRGMLGEMDLQDEGMASAKDWLAERAKEWAVESDRLNLIRSGTVLAEAPELTPWEFTKLLFTQPMMATVELLDKYFSILPRPLYAAATIGAHRLFKTPEDTAAARLEELYNYYRSMGETSWSAYAMAFNEWDAPWWLKLGGETFFDPITYIGLGMATAVAKKIGTGLTKVGLRSAGTRIGPWVQAVEQGWLAGEDAIFKMGVKAVLFPVKGAFWLTGAGYTIPRTYTMMARNFARSSYMKFSAVLQRTFPKVRNLKGLTAKDAIDTGINAIDNAIARPMEGHDMLVRAGAPLLEFGYIDDLAARKMVREVAEEITFDTNRLAHFNNEVLNMFSGQGERVTAGKIIADLGQEATEDAVNKMAAKLVSFKQKVADTAKAALKGDTAEDVLMSVFRRLEGIRYDNLHSPLTKYMGQAGRSASWHSRVADRILYSSQLVAMERRLVMPMARWNLLFTNFGPYNFAENMGRSFLGGGEVLYPKAYSGIDETNRLLGGLANAPYELQMMARGEVRLTQAMVDPVTGRAAVFKGGKVPFITKDVTMPGWVPKWLGGGKPIGRNMNIAGRDHFLGSFQGGYDMWGFFNNMQVGYDYQVHYLKALADVAPDSMDNLAGIVSRRSSELDNIASISVRDARDIERVLLQDATVGPDAIRAHQALDVLEFERRQVSKDLGRTFDKCTDVRMMTKNGIRDEVLDGSIFTDIDGRMAAWLGRERELSLVSLKNQMDVLTSEADNFLANPPRNLDEFLGDMQNISSLVEGTGERIHDYRRLTELRKAKLVVGEMDDFEVGSAKLLAEYMDTSEVQLTKIMNQLVDRARAPRVVLRELSTEIQSSVIDVHPRLNSLIWENFPDLMPDFNVYVLGGKITGREFDNVVSAMSRNKKFVSGLKDALRQANLPETFTVYRGARKGARLAEDYTNVTLTQSVARDIRRKISDVPASDWEVTSFTAKLDDVVGMGKANETELFFRTGSLEAAPTGPILNEVQLARLTDLDSVSRLELENILATRNRISEIEAIIPRTAKRKRDERFWLQQRSQKATIWDTFDTNARKFKDLRLRASRNFLTSVDKPVFVPDFVPEVVEELTPNHLAYLYGATGDDLYRGLTRIQHHATIRPRDDFILHTLEQADAYAAKMGKTAASLGFTDDAIGEVYDQMWRNLGIEPTILTPDSPTVLQLEEVRQELTRLHGAYKLPGAPVLSPTENLMAEGREIVSRAKVAKVSSGELQSFSDALAKAEASTGREQLSALRVMEANEDAVRKLLGIKPGEALLQPPDIVKWRKYINGVADEVGDLPIYKVPTVPEVGIIHKTSPIGDVAAVKSGKKLFAEQGEDIFQLAIKKPDSELFTIERIGDGSEVLYLKSRAGEAAPIVERLKEMAGTPATAGKIIERGRMFGYSEADINAFLKKQDLMPPTATDKWWANKEAAMTKARDMHALAYPTYDDANIIDESMRAIFPFWNYELFRWRWIPRTYLRTPGTMTGLARFMNYTDQGYLPVPGTDLQMNILRGSVWMGGLRSFYLRDFPEYYDVMPGMEFIDYIGRAGFFPGIHVMLPIVMFGAATGKPEIGQLAPAWVRTGLSGLRALSPEHIGAILEHIYPDRFRDYMTMMTLGEEGYDADLIWRKKQTGEKLTEEEEKIWLDAVNRVDGVKGILMQQTGLFRIRPQEFTEIRKEMRLAIEEATGVPIRVQEQIDRQYPVTGKRFSDYYSLDVMQQKLLYEWETYRRWQGIITPLYPSSWQMLDVKTRDYYEELERVYNEARTVGVYEDDKLIRPSMVEMNRQFVEGEIGPDQWMGFRSDMTGSLAEAVRILGESPAYKDVPKTFEERAAMLEERNIPTPTQTPDQELLYYYYELRPEYKWNWESQRMERDFDTYYAYIDILLESLDAPHRERLLQRIQSDWTPMEKLYWQISREYMRPYRNLRAIVLREYEPEQVQQIRRYEVAPAAEREELRDIIGPEGEKLIAGYQRRLREARQRFRILDPETDAWLNFFGTTTALMSTEAKQIYDELRKKYLVKDMIK